MISQESAQDAFTELFPQRKVPHIAIEYSGRFSTYNANVTAYPTRILFKLSKQWQEVDDIIVKGLLQHLLLRLEKKTRNSTRQDKTLSIELYEAFQRQMHITIDKIHTDPILEASFKRMNASYLDGQLEQPNLKWGTDATRTIGTYNYHSDTITISTVLQDAPHTLLDLVMYHEMLHKKHKFYSTAARTMHHSPAFRKDERRYKDFAAAEKELHAFIARKKRKKKKGRGILERFLS